MSLQRSALRIAHVLTTITVIAFVLGQPGIALAQTEPMVLVTVTITQVVQIECDEGAFAGCPDDYFSKVTIAGENFESDYVDDQADISPNWSFAKVLARNAEPTLIDIGIWDHDGGSADDELNASPGDEPLHLSYNLQDGTWSGETDQSDSQGSNVRFYFTITQVSAIPVTVTITRVEELTCDEGALAGCPDDYFSKVTIAGENFESVYVDDQADISPNWTLTQYVDPTLPAIPIDIGIWDHDGASANDELSASPGDEPLHISFNLQDGTWSGETIQDFSQGRNVRFFFNINILGGSGDTDGDGLLNQWESNGLDMDGDGAVDLNLPAWGADPNRKDIFVEVDCLVAVDHSHCPMPVALEDVVRAFAEAPVSNPDGSSGIQLHIDTGALYGTGIITQVSGTGGVVGNLGDMGGGGSQIAEAGNTIVYFDGAAGSTRFYDLKANNFNYQRELIFRYAIFAHQTTNIINGQPTVDCTSGVAEDIPGNDFIVSLGGWRDIGANGTMDAPCWGSIVGNGLDDDGDGKMDEDPYNGRDDDGDCFADTNLDTFICGLGDLGVDEDFGISVGVRNEQAGTFMHELGHAVGFGHGGGDAINRKPNYLSVMNYGYQPCSVPGMKTKSGFSPIPGGCDYSRIDLPDLNEKSLDECVGIGIVLGLGPRDWNGNTINEGMSCPSNNNSNIPADINGDNFCILPGQNTILETRPFGDDILVPAIGPPTSINIGPNGICESTAVSDDVQASLLASYEDWNTLFYAFRSLGNFVNGVSSPVQDEPTPELIERARALLREQTKLTFDLETNGIFRAMAVQSDGKILIGGHFSNVAGHLHNQIARLNANGSLDTSFNPDRWGQVYALAVQSDTKILLGGRSAQVAGQPRHFIARLNVDGVLDTTFTPDVNGNVRGLAVQSDGKILLVGQFTQVDGQPRRYIARLNPDGLLDTTFTPEINPHGIAVAVQADGKILVGGRFTLVNGQHRRFLVRLKSDGSLDTAFNPGSEYRGVMALAIEPDGKILLADAFPETAGLPHDQIARLNPDGTIDTTYSPGLGHYAFSLAGQGDGTILLGGNHGRIDGEFQSYITRLIPLLGD